MLVRITTLDKQPSEVQITKALHSLCVIWFVVILLLHTCTTLNQVKKIKPAVGLLATWVQQKL